MDPVSKVNRHHTKYKGDMALSYVNFDLTRKGYFTFLPTSENCEYDIIADTGVLWRIQVKMSCGGDIPSTSTWNDRNGHHRKNIDTTRFDLFAVVNEDCTKIAYCPSIMAGKRITWEQPTSRQRYYWWEDFSDIKHYDSMPEKTLTPGESAIEWPCYDDLKLLSTTKSYSAIARSLGCSAASVRRKLTQT